MDRKMKFRRILSSVEQLGQKIYECDVPDDIIQMAKRTRARYVGVGNWYGTRRKFICFVSETGSPIYMDKSAFDEVVKFFREFKV